jgi:hypothetical protein
MPNGRCRMHGESSMGANGGRDERLRQARTIHAGAQRRDDRTAPGDGPAEASGAEDDCGGVVRGAHPNPPAAGQCVTSSNTKHEASDSR